MDEIIIFNMNSDSVFFLNDKKPIIRLYISFLKTYKILIAVAI